MTAHQIVLFLNKTNFDIYADHWNEQDLYFGRHHQKVRIPYFPTGYCMYDSTVYTVVKLVLSIQ